MRFGRGIVASAFSSVLLAHGLARAQDAHLQAGFTGSVGVTDNVASALKQDPGGPEADGFAVLAPRILATYVTPRTAQTLTYTFTANRFLRQSSASSYTSLADYSTRFITSPTTTLVLGANGSYGRLNTFSRALSPGMTPLTALPPTSTRFVQGGVNEAFSKQLSPVVNAGEAVSCIVYRPFNDTLARTYNTTGTLNAQRVFSHDTGTLALSFGYTHFDNVAVTSPTSATATYTSRDQLVNTLVASWAHNFGHHYSSQLDLGVSQATDLRGGYGQLWQPVGLAAGRYTRDMTEAELAYAHAAMLNVFLGQISLVDQLTLRLAAPLRRAANLSIEGSVGAQRGRPIIDGKIEYPHTTVVLADAALIWRPILVVPNFQLGLRYQHISQLATAKYAKDDTQLFKNTLILSVSGAFPRTTETSAQILMTQPFGSAGPERPAKQKNTDEEESNQATEGEPAASGEMGR